MDWFDQLSNLFYLVIAMLLGGIIGLERDLAGKPAGIRTHMLISGVSAFLVETGIAFITHFNTYGLTQLLRPDPFRIMSSVITGLSFIGAGSIIRSNNEEKIEGLTTAASLLFASAIGMGIALGLYYLCTGATFFVVLVNRVIIYFENWAKRNIGKRPTKNHL